MSSLDEVIEAHSQKLKLLKNHKKGLMQNLFPQEGEKVPKLRFPEFEEDGEWVKKELGEVGKIILGGTPDTNEPSYWNGGINWITPAEMGKNKRYAYNTLRTLTERGIKKSSNLLPVNSVIISTRAPIGYLIINKTKMAFNQGCKGIILDKYFYYLFIYYYLLLQGEKLNNLGSGSTFKELSKNTLESLKISLPSFPEQQKIASCLSALDELITAEADKIAQLQQHKKGLMQGLFPNPSASSGETMEN